MSGLVVMGASLGGLRALECVLGALPADFGWPVLIVQHRADDRSAVLHALLDDRCALEVCEAEDKSPLRPGCVLVAPAGYHALVEGEHVELSTEAQVRHSRPSIDVTFESAARAFGPYAVGVVLTGANDDGARGLAEISRRGGMAIVQDPETAEGRAMPEAAIRAVGPVDVLAPGAIGARLVEIVTAEVRS